MKTREGRPIHLTGNDEHPASSGKTSPRAMADILRLYDPDRLRAPRMDDLPATWESIAKVMMKTLGAAKRNGRPVLLMTGAVPSPSRRALIADFKEFLPTLEHVAWEPAEGVSQQAAVASYGSPVALSPKARPGQGDRLFRS